LHILKINRDIAKLKIKKLGQTENGNFLQEILILAANMSIQTTQNIDPFYQMERLNLTFDLIFKVN